MVELNEVGNNGGEGVAAITARTTHLQHCHMGINMQMFYYSMIIE